ncbi:MAG TPA: methyltransferase [Acidobacteriaceae bacterium]|nr:methyltransferase [Acidobacteriaceae bacterium]
MKRVLPWEDGGFFLAFSALIMFRAHWGARAWIGVVIAASGFVLWIAARLLLGNSFSPGAHANTLVTAGLYSKLRHPIYFFEFIVYVEVLMIWGNWIAFLMLYADIHG